MTEQRPTKRWLAVIEFDAANEQAAYFALETGQAGSGIQENLDLIEIKRGESCYIIELGKEDDG